MWNKNIDIAIDVEEHPKATGPAKLWILQFHVHTFFFVTINIRVMLLTSAVMVLFYN